jgi:hypothetical protein
VRRAFDSRLWCDFGEDGMLFDRAGGRSRSSALSVSAKRQEIPSRASMIACLGGVEQASFKQVKLDPPTHLPLVGLQEYPVI